MGALKPISLCFERNRSCLIWTQIYLSDALTIENSNFRKCRRRAPCVQCAKIPTFAHWTQGARRRWLMSRIQASVAIIPGLFGSRSYFLEACLLELIETGGAFGDHTCWKVAVETCSVAEGEEIPRKVKERRGGRGNK